MRCHGIPLKKKSKKKTGVGGWWGWRGAQLAYYHLNNLSTCRSGPTGRRRENIVGIEGEWPLFIFQWTASGLHRPNPGTIHPETRALPSPRPQHCSSSAHIHASFLNPNMNTCFHVTRPAALILFLLASISARSAEICISGCMREGPATQHLHQLPLILHKSRSSRLM